MRVEGKNGTKLHLFLNDLNIGISNEGCKRVAKKRTLLTLQRFGSVARILPKERINCFVRCVSFLFVSRNWGLNFYS